MNITNKTILITGGGSGIGLETAKLLSAKGNKVIIVGRDGEKLKEAVSGIKNIFTITCDITKERDVANLLATVKSEYSNLDILINNAAVGAAYKLFQVTSSFDKATEEIATNYLAMIRLVETFLPMLKEQNEAAVVNVSSVTAFSPLAIIPTYSDTKAAIHSFTQTLRFMLSKDTSIKVFELMPPLVNTPLSKEIGGAENGMDPLDVAVALINGLEDDVFEILVGDTKAFHDFFFSNPKEAFKTMNKNM